MKSQLKRLTIYEIRAIVDTWLGNHKYNKRIDMIFIIGSEM
nr:MAG TPA: hypothetical protein [Caudoviricetes sp.]DAY15997.1 MAG TPA: hypothetical protein [Caudoviricetes sp.]